VYYRCAGAAQAYDKTVKGWDNLLGVGSDVSSKSLVIPYSLTARLLFWN